MNGTSENLQDLLKDLNESVSTEKDGELLDIQGLLKQIDSAGKVLDLIDHKADALLAQMDQIIQEAGAEEK